MHDDLIDGDEPTPAPEGPQHDFEPFDPAEVYSGPLPELYHFRRDPSPETHRAAAKVLARSGTLALDGDLFSLEGGRVCIRKPAPTPENQTNGTPNVVGKRV